jgi:hypothetical protein
LATYQAIAAVGRAILRLLTDACPRDVFPSAQFEFLPVLESEQPIKEGITLCLYRVGANAARRTVPSRPRLNGQRRLPSLAVDLYFLITPWASNADALYRLLGWAMRVLDDTPILPMSLLNAFGPDAATFQPDETVELIFEPVSLSDMSLIWENLRPRVQLSATYVARMIVLESTVERVEAGDVQARVFEYTKGPGQ